MSGRIFASKRGRILHRPRSEKHARKAIARLCRQHGGRPVYVRGQLVAHEFPDGFVVCERRRYRSHADAMAELAAVWAFAHLHTHRLPRRPYACPHCGGWHVTST